MKKTIFVIYTTFLLSLGNFVSCEPSKKNTRAISHHDLLTHTKELTFEKNISFCKLLVIPAIIGITILYNKQNFLKTIQENSFLSALVICAFANFILDTALKYKQINHTLALFELSKTMSRYMLYAIAIKNTMNQIAKKDNCCSFKEDDFFKTVTHQIPLSFQELEQFIFELLHNCIKTIDTMHIQIHTDVEEKIYLLCKEHVTLQDVMCLYDNDADFCQYLQNLLTNPQEHYKTAALALNALIKKNLEYMIKYQPEN